jgi:phosphoglycerol transferase
MVYQLPYTRYPHAGFANQMPPNDHAKAYALSRHLRWSWPALSGPAVALNRRLEAMAPAERVRALAAVGYAAVWIDRMGYADGGAAMMEALTAEGARPLAQSASKVIAVYDLAPVRERLGGEAALAAQHERLLHADELHVGDRIDFSRKGMSALVVGRGWSSQEDSLRWTDGKRADIRLKVAAAAANAPLRLRLAGSVALGAIRTRQTMTVLINGQEAARFTFQAGQDAPALIVPLDPRGLGDDRKVVVSLLFEDVRSPKALGLSQDDRQLGIALSSIALETAP